MNSLAVLVSVCAFAPSVRCATTAFVWCYHQSTCNDTLWPVLSPTSCSGIRQSPININSTSAKPNSNLTTFEFKNYSSTSALKTIKNTAHTVKVTLESGVGISGGGLSEPYDCLQFHLHWGNGSSVPGSEHTVDDKRYAMELHIVCSKSSYNGNTTVALLDPTGFAALGFFVEVKSGSATGQPAGWATLTSYLSNITNTGDSVAMAPGISLDDLLVGVDRTKYYRYLGSLTTPTCNEAVVWTVFKDSIKVSKDLIDLFSTTVRFTNSTSSFMTNVYRSIQPALEVTTQPNTSSTTSSSTTTTSSASSSSSSSTCYSLGLMVLSVALGVKSKLNFS